MLAFLVHVHVPQLLSSRVQTPVKTEVTKDRFYLLTKTRALRVPSPFSNDGNFVVRQDLLARRKILFFLRASLYCLHLIW